MPGDEIKKLTDSANALAARISKLNEEIEDLEASKSRLLESESRVFQLRESLLGDVERTFLSGSELGVMRKFRAEMESVIEGAAYDLLVGSSEGEREKISAEISRRLREIEELEGRISALSAEITALYEEESRAET